MADRHHSFLDDAKRHDADAVKACIISDPDIVNVQPAGRWSCLHQFAEAGDVETVKWLLEHGADVTATSKDGKTPLDVAHARCRSVLSDSGVSPVGEPAKKRIKFGDDDGAAAKKQPSASVTAHMTVPKELEARWKAHAEPVKVIGFYSHSKGTHPCFSNFFQHDPISFTIPSCALSEAFLSSGRKHIVDVRCSEKAIMLCKAAAMGDLKKFDEISTATTPAKAKALGRAVAPFDAELWTSIVCTVARQAVLQKFKLLPKLKAELLSTDPEALIAEATKNDRVWGIGLNVGDAAVQNPSKWCGANILGWALMEARDSLS